MIDSVPTNGNGSPIEAMRQSKANMTIFQYAVRHTNERGLAATSGRQLTSAATRLQEACGRPLRMTELTDELVNDWVDLLLEQETRSPVTVNTLRGQILTLWRAAFAQGLVDAPPLRIRKIRLERKQTEAWAIDDVNKLLSVTYEVQGWYRTTGVRKREFWPAWIRAAWDTGLRRGDLWRLRFDQLEEDRTMLVTQHKTGNEIRVKLRRSTLEAIQNSLKFGQRVLMLPWMMQASHFSNEFQKLVSRAGLVGSGKWLRRSAATAVENEQPGIAGRFLGHTPKGENAVAHLHYLAPKLLKREAIQPPELNSKSEMDSQANS